MTRHAQVWHLEDIKAELRKRHGSLRALSPSWGYHRGAITKVLTDPRYSEVLERRIASALAVSLHVLWPDRWTETGEPLPRTGEREPTRAASVETSQKRKAA